MNFWLLATWFHHYPIIIQNLKFLIDHKACCSQSKGLKQILIVNALQAFKSRIEEMREAIQRNRQRKPFPSPLPPSNSRQKKAKVRRKSEDKAAAASAAAAGDRAATPATPDSKAAMLVTTTANFGETNSTPV